MAWSRWIWSGAIRQVWPLPSCRAGTSQVWATLPSLNVDFSADLSSPSLRSLFSLNSRELHPFMTPSAPLLDTSVRRQRSTFFFQWRAG